MGIDPIMMALSNDYTDSQRLARIYKKKLSFDGNVDGKETVEFDEGIWAIKISDEPISEESVKRITFTSSNGNVEQKEIGDLYIEKEDACFTVVLEDIPALVIVKEPFDEFTRGVYIGFFGTASLYTWVSAVEYETIHPIDLKFLPGVTLNLCDYGINVYELFKKGTSGYFRMDTSLARELNAKIPTDGSMVVLMTNDGINPKVLSKPVTIACLPNGKAGIVSILYKTLYFELNAILDTELYISFTYNQTDGSIDATDVYYTTTAKALPTTEVN